MPLAAGLTLTLSLLATGAVHAACWAPAQGALAALEALAFRAPAAALARLAPLQNQPEFAAPMQRAAWHALAADASRQLGQDTASLAHAQAGLAALGAQKTSDLGLRLRAAQAMQSDSITEALAEMDAVLLAVGPRPLARGCVLRDRGWLRLDTPDMEGALADLIQSYTLLAAHADRDEQMVAMGRLSMAYGSSGDHAAALQLTDESVAHFRSTQAWVRLTTALNRRSHSLAALKRLPEAEAALREALQISRDQGDASGAGQILMSLCGVVGRHEGPGREQEARKLCAEAESVLRQAQSADDGSLRTLAMLRVELLRSRGPNAAEMADLNDLIQVSLDSDTGMQLRARRARAQALAARGDHRGAHADLLQVVALQRRATESERIKAQASMRVRFETDRALARSAVLDEQNQRGNERVAWLAVAAAGLLAAAGGLGYALLLNRRHQLRLTQVAERDDLTGLPNRRKIMEDAEQQFALARRRGSALVIGMLDIDHFKRINDTQGHAGGDLVLAAFGQSARPALRSTDSLGRWGGEEFLLVLPDCALHDGADVAERLRKALALGDGKASRYTVSIGVAALSPADATLQALLQRADTALYAAKAQGRDRVVLDGLVSPAAQMHDTLASFGATASDAAAPPQRRKAERRQRSPT